MTIDYYDKFAAEWVATHSGSLFDGDARRFIALIRGNSILEIGPGSGRHARMFIAAGFDYTGIDPSAGMLAIATRNNPGGRFIHCDLFDYNKRVDGIWACASLLHLTKADMIRALAKMRSILRPHGWVFISLKAGDGEGVDETGRYFSYYQAEELDELLKDWVIARSDEVKSSRLWLTRLLCKE